MASAIWRLAEARPVGRLLLRLDFPSPRRVESVRPRKGRDIDVSASVSIHHLALNELTLAITVPFAKLDPPLAAKNATGQALLRGVEDGTIRHYSSPIIDRQSADANACPLTAKRAPGAGRARLLLAVGLETRRRGKSSTLMAFLARRDHQSRCICSPQGRTAQRPARLRPPSIL